MFEKTTETRDEIDFMSRHAMIFLSSFSEASRYIPDPGMRVLRSLTSSKPMTTMTHLFEVINSTDLPSKQLSVVHMKY